MRVDRKDSDFIPEMPALVGHEILLDYLWTVGPAMAGVSGPQPLSHSEILAWQTNTYIRLNAWEAGLLRQLSAEYVAEGEAAHSPSRPAPFAPATTVETRAVVAQQVQNAFAAMMANAKQKKVAQ